MSNQRPNGMASYGGQEVDAPPSMAGTPATFAEAAERIRAAWLILAESAPEAVDTLRDVMANGRNDLARVNAATAVLDRIGIPARADVSVRLSAPVEDTSGEDPQAVAIATLRSRMAQLTGGAPAVIVDAEVVSETDGEDLDGMVDGLTDLFG